MTSHRLKRGELFVLKKPGIRIECWEWTCEVCDVRVPQVFGSRRPSRKDVEMAGVVTDCDASLVLGVMES